MDAQEIGRHLRETRVERGISQAGLERLSGVPKARLSRYENGWVMPRLDVLAHITAAMHVPLWQFLQTMPDERLRAVL